MQPSLRALAVALLALFTQAGGAAEIRAHPAPAGEPLSTNFTVTVGNLNVPVYVAKVAPKDPVLRFKSVDEVATSGTYFEKAAFASVDFAGSIEVSISCPETITSAKLLPSRLGIRPVISGNRLSFKLSDPGLLTIEVNGDWVHSLHLFANALETEVPKTNAPNVIFFGPGIHELDELRVTSGKTVYLADGAILRGKPTLHHRPTVSLVGDNITLRGRGIIDGSLCPIHTQNLLFLHGTNLVVDGIILRDSSVWTVPVRECQKVRITNLKLFGSRANSDGIDICNSRDVEVSNCFLRTLDDLVVVKTDKGQGPAENIRVKNCVLWNEVAHALSIGAELREPVSNVRFSNCDVIHDKGREWTLRVFQCDSALISNIAFEDIRVEETRNLISL
ncbi:MAG TPA: glycosyl hydrolase family 28 protein, partial [Candidatus Sulfotelmatobacter sp.]|nr:glycosyl hydrolase family 28 protein [Candidatus Sulfotelmatobacter sp.]